MKYAYDIHIHSVLSPCADVLMTPNNIFNMAKLKQLDIISITDHNSLKQLSTCHELSKSYDMLFIPGVEITVSENFDVLCYFKKIDDALKFDQILDEYVVKQVIKKDHFKDQEIMNLDDEIIDIYPYALSEPLKLSIYKLIELLKPFESLLVFAHVDRNYRSGKAFVNLIDCDAIEVDHLKNKSSFLNTNKPILYNSDAHQITDILERTKDNTISLESLDIESFFKYFNHD